jgi:hypothetical protein
VERSCPREQVALDRLPVGQRGQVVEVGVGDEVAVEAAGEHHHLRLVRLLGEGGEVVGQLAHRHEVHPVGGLAAEGEHGHAVVVLQGPSGHGPDATDVTASTRPCAA